jgi:hypothetical protein
VDSVHQVARVRIFEASRLKVGQQSFVDYLRQDGGVREKTASRIKIRTNAVLAFFAIGRFLLFAFALAPLPPAQRLWDQGRQLLIS